VGPKAGLEEKSLTSVGKRNPAVQSVARRYTDWAMPAQVANNNVTCIPIARQRLYKHVPAKQMHATEGHPLLGNGPVNTHQ
jgi:hypothetical protein